MAMVVGFQWLVSGAGSKKWSLFSFMLSLLSLFTFAVAVSYISFLAAKLRVDFIPSGYSPSNGEVITSMYILYEYSVSGEQFQTESIVFFCRFTHSC